MKFSEVVKLAVALLRESGRVTHRALKREFALDDEALADLIEELIEGQRVAIDEGGKVLVWTGTPREPHVDSGEQPKTAESPSLRSLSSASPPEAERRQLTVMFCDLVDSTALSTQLDPEDLHAVVRGYQRTCAEVIQRYEGYIAQYLGDGVLVYFGYPTAHEDDAQRAVRAGLEIVQALQKWVPSPLVGKPVLSPSTPLRNAQDRPVEGGQSLPRTRYGDEGVVGAQHAAPLQVRVGIHTGVVVVGEMGRGNKREQLALGDTPNIAARLQGLAEPNTVVVSAVTQRLIAGFFECHDGGLQVLKGVSAPLQAYRVLSESSTQSRLEVEVSTGRLTPLVGRAHEVGLILERWATAQAGEGQIVLLNGEPGIGKSRLVQEVKGRVIQQGAISLELRCSPYSQNSAFSPVLMHLQHVLHWQRKDSPQVRLDKLQQTLVRYRFPQGDTLPLLAALLSLPRPQGAPPLTLSPQKQKQKTQEALVAWLVEEAERHPVYCVWEDLHWADPSTLDLLGLLLDQVPMARLLVLLTARPEFVPPWSSRTHLTPLSLSRLPRMQAGEMIEKVTGGKPLPVEVHQQIVNKTDGVPLFVEELTKMVLESGLLRETDGQYALTAPLPPLAIPTTLHDSLMARLDRLATVKEVAQVGATLGREFSYELLHAVSPVEEISLQQALTKLVEAEVLYQRGLPPHARYVFKHALIQDAAYQSLLKSRRQQYHQQIAQVLEAQFADLTETRPELLAHHYTEAGLPEQAIPYWQRAGQRAVERSANEEAIGHLTKGLELLKTLPDTPRRAQHELFLQLTLGNALLTTRGYAAPEVAKAYTRARELCQQVGDTPHLFPVLWGSLVVCVIRAELQKAREVADRLLHLAEERQDAALLLEAHYAVGIPLFWLGEFGLARTHLEQALGLYDPPQHRLQAVLYGQEERGVTSLAYAAWALWHLGYADQALARAGEALTLAHELVPPFSQAFALCFAAWLHQSRREGDLTRERAAAVIALATEQGFPDWLAWGTILQGWALTEQGRGEEGIAQMRQGLATYQATGAELARPYFLALLAEAYGKVGQAEEGLGVIAEAMRAMTKNGERQYEAELYRLKGELMLQQEGKGQSAEDKVPDPQS
ncbi:MAG: adenylate/guanylate cyclase domain-containing protein, partial [Thermodesulfobacteriota bacterium]